MTKGDLDSFLKYCDKDLYLDMREQQITIPQFKARVSERYFGIKFVVIDDLRKELENTRAGMMRSKSGGNQLVEMNSPKSSGRGGAAGGKQAVANAGAGTGNDVNSNIASGRLGGNEKEQGGKNMTSA